MNQETKQIIQEIRKKTDFVPKIALTLGSGLGPFADEIKVVTEISYRDLPGFPVSTAPGHEGKYIFGYLEQVPVVCMKGRIHYYEGYDRSLVVLPVRVVQGLGAKILFLTNAAGSLREQYAPGTLMLITDHISCFVENPLIGPNDEEEGVRFPDMSEVYDKKLQEIIRSAARDEGILLKEGVYVQLTGPSYETPAEIKMLKALGADLVGMSTVVEAIAARHTGMRVCCLSLVTNYGAGLTTKKLSSEEVMEAADAASPQFSKLVKTSMIRMRDE